MKKNKFDILVRAAMILIGISFLFPLYWMVNISFKSKSEGYDNPFGLPHLLFKYDYFDSIFGEYVCLLPEQNELEI